MPGFSAAARRTPDPGLVQTPVGALEDRTWDAVIVGAGPAGCVAASDLAEAGLRVLLIERHSFPRDKVCGDGLLPDALRILERLGVAEQVLALGHESRVTRIFSPSRIWVDLPGRFVSLPRRELDSILAGRATRSGATLAHGRVSAIEPDGPAGVTVRFAEGAGAVRARVGILATGADVSLLRPLGMVLRPEPSAVALRCYIRSAVEAEDWVVSLDRAVLPGYAWIFPMGNGIYNVGVGAFSQHKTSHRLDLHRMLKDFLAQFPLARTLLECGEAVSRPVGARLRCGLIGSTGHATGRIVAIGEAIGATYPFTGEGVGKAMETGAIAAEHAARVLRGEDETALEKLPAEITSRLGPRYRGYFVAERWLSHAWLTDLLAARARASERIRAKLAGILNETTDPVEAFSMRGLIASLVG